MLPETATAIVEAALRHNVIAREPADPVAEAERLLEACTTAVDQTNPAVVEVRTIAEREEKGGQDQQEGTQEAAPAEAPGEEGAPQGDDVAAPGGGAAGADGDDAGPVEQHQTGEAGSGGDAEDGAGEQEQADAGPEPAGEAPQQGEEGEHDAGTADTEAGTPDDGTGRTGSLVADVIASANRRIDRLGIPRPKLPDEMQGSAMDFPHDITRLSDDDWRRMHWQQHVLDVYASVQLTDAEEEVDGAERMAQHRLNEVYNDIEKRELEAKSGRTVTSMKAEAAEDTHHVELTRLAQEARHFARKLKQLRDGYRSSCDRLSREWTSRQGVRDANATPQPGRR